MGHGGSAGDGHGRDGGRGAGQHGRVFDEEGALDKFEGFASEHGARFYGLPLNEGTVTLVRESVIVPERVGEILAALSPRPFVFNLGHGILPETPVAHVERLVSLVRGG